MTHLDVVDWIVVLLLACVPLLGALVVALLGSRSDRRRWRDSGRDQRPGYVETRPRW